VPRLACLAHRSRRAYSESMDEQARAERFARRGLCFGVVVAGALFGAMMVPWEVFVTYFFSGFG
jgi:hypothetical protein